MKAVIVSNCNAKAYYNYLAALFPDWDTRYVLKTEADAWIASGHEKFLEFLSEVDVFIGLPESHEKLFPKHLNKAAVQVLLPSFIFMGGRPDCVLLAGITSATRVGVIHSRIAAAAFVAGKSVEEAAALYCARHFEALGYFDSYAGSRRQLLDSYRSFGVDLEEEFEAWRGYGDFMYTPSHPQTRLLFDVLHKALAGKGIVTGREAGFVAQSRAGFEDYLARGIIWPVYPEIAERLALSNCKTRWRSSAAKGAGTEFGLRVMLERSYASFAARPDARRRITVALGGKEKLRELAGEQPAV